MNTCETKLRKTQTLIRLGANSKKSNNSFPSSAAATTTATTLANTKLKDINNNKYGVSRSTKLSKQNASNSSLHGKANTILKRDVRNKTDAVKKSVHSNNNNKSLTAKHSATSKKVVKRAGQLAATRATAKAEKSNILLDKPSTSEIGIQAAENEILDHSLVVGDCKFITASIAVTNEITNMRKEADKKNYLGTLRKFEEHAKKEEQQLDDLKEYLDKSYISRKTPKLCYTNNILEEDRKLIESMDELLQREKPKFESITDIKSRIKHKEQELLSLFDRFQKTESFAKTSV